MLAGAPSKKAIAKELGLDRSTVSKILNNYDVEKFAPETVNRVRAAAQDMGFVRNQRRMHARKSVKGLAEVEIYLEKDGSLFGKGLVYLRDLSVSGMLVNILEMEGIPCSPFRLKFKILDAAEGLNGMELGGRAVRLSGGVQDRLLGLGVEFEQLADETRKELREFLAISLN